MSDLDSKTRVELTQEELSQIQIKHKLNLENDIKVETYKKQVRQDRLDQGKKINVITKIDLVSVINLWFDGGRKVVSKCFNSVYDADTDSPYKEVDWVKCMPNSVAFGKVLLSAVNSSMHGSAILARGSNLYGAYKTDTVFTPKSLTWRIRRLNDILEIEEKILRLETENALFRATMKIPSELTGWKLEAMRLLYSGKKQQEVADIVSKSLITIKRLAKSQKEQNL